METSNPLLKREGAFIPSMAQTEVMSLQGVINKSGILLLLCLGSAAFAWTHPEIRGPLLVVGLVGGLIACLVGIFKPTTCPVTAPLYALLEGLVLGAISYVFQTQFRGIVVNALLLTFGVLALMLMLYTSRTIRVTSGLAKGIFAATAAVGIVYFIDILLNMFGMRMPLIHQGGVFGIGISVVIAGIAAFNLLLDFAVIENAVNSRSPRYMEWYCGMSLLITLVWLYLEILRLLAKLRGRD